MFFTHSFVGFFFVLRNMYFCVPKFQKFVESFSLALEQAKKMLVGLKKQFSLNSVLQKTIKNFTFELGLEEKTLFAKVVGNSCLGSFNIYQLLEPHFSQGKWDTILSETKMFCFASQRTFKQSWVQNRLVQSTERKLRNSLLLLAFVSFLLAKKKGWN